MPSSQISQEIRKSATDTGLAVVGVTDLAVERLRSARTRAEKIDVELEVKRLQERVQQAPTVAVTFGLEAAGKVEETYGDLTVRGRKLVDRIKKQRATQDLVEQGKTTLSRTKAAVTTVRRGSADTKTAAKATTTTARREADEVVTEAKKTTRKRTQGTKSAAKRTSTTARKRAATSKSTAKGAATSARKTASQAAKATEAAAEKVGD